MNLLQIVDEVRKEASVSGGTLGTVNNATGETARLVTWVKRAYEELQNMYDDWWFLRKQDTFTTQDGVNIIPKPSDLNIWDVSRLFDNGGAKIDLLEYTGLEHKIDASHTGKPYLFYINGDNTLLADRMPDDEYTYTFDYFRVPFEMTQDADEPAFPAQFHRVLVGRALIFYGNYEAAVEVKQQGGEMYQSYLRGLMTNQLPHKRQFYGRSEPEEIRVVAQ